MPSTTTPGAPRSGPGVLAGPRKVAILFMALGEEGAAEVARHLSPEEVEAVSLEIARMDPVDPETMEAVLREWHDTDGHSLPVNSGGVQFAGRVLERALGPQAAASSLQRIEEQLTDRIAFTQVKDADPQQLTALLRGEHPQTVALILAHLPPKLTAGVLRELELEMASQVTVRMARMDKVLPDVLRIIQASLGSDSDLSLGREGVATGGPPAVAEVLNLVPGLREKELLEGIARTDPQLSEQIRNLMFVFEDVRKLDDRAIARILRDVETRQLASALKVASDELRERMLGNLSARAREALTQEMEFLGPVRVSDVQQAQAEVIKVVRALEAAGEITLGGDDDVVVG